ncbi:MAG: hypothetical protein KDC27_07610, partial [Acidobacteria bacterium]|nr:hypothetical protein [Acidobacteriota bacterium]
AAAFLASHWPDPADPDAAELFSTIGGAPEQRQALAGYLRRPEVSIELMTPLARKQGLELARAEWKALETELKYAGYLDQQRRHVERLRKAETRRIPEDFAFAGLPGLSREVVEKMERVRPRTLAQAGRIPGITPAALSILNMHLESPGR